MTSAMNSAKATSRIVAGSRRSAGATTISVSVPLGEDSYIVAIATSDAVMPVDVVGVGLAH